MFIDHNLLAINTALRAHDRRFFQVRMLTVFVEASLNISSLKTTQKWLSLLRNKVDPATESETIVLIDRYSTIFNRIQGLPAFKGRCLSRSLVFRLMLCRKGIFSDLRIGVCQHNGTLNAHAWLERDGKPINDHPAAIAHYFILPESKLDAIKQFK